MDKNILIRAAISGLLLGTVTGTTSCSKLSMSPGNQIGHCQGVNSCKGKGECGGKGHGCAGLNQCKGKGWIRASESQCADLKGNFEG
jgi:hypothetical protein